MLACNVGNAAWMADDIRDCIIDTAGCAGVVVPVAATAVLELAAVSSTTELGMLVSDMLKFENSTWLNSRTA